MDTESSVPVIDNYIAGTFVPPSTSNYIPVINPATGMFILIHLHIVNDKLSLIIYHYQSLLTCNPYHHHYRKYR